MPHIELPRRLWTVVSMCDECWSPARAGGTNPSGVDTLVIDGSATGRVALGLIGAVSGGPDVSVGHTAEQGVPVPRRRTGVEEAAWKRLFAP